MPSILRTSFDGDPNIGLYGFATDKYCIIGSERYAAKVKETLKVKTHPLTLLNMDLVRIFCTGNSHGIMLPVVLKNFDPGAVSDMREKFEVLVIDDRHSSVGNLVMLNDNGIILSPLLKKHKPKLEKFFGLPCEVTGIAGMNIVGNLGFATNKGCLLHPKVREKEKKIIEKTLGVDADITTVNFGSQYPGAGLIANSNGLVVSDISSGPELGRITDVLGFLG